MPLHVTEPGYRLSITPLDEFVHIWNGDEDIRTLCTEYHLKLHLLELLQKTIIDQPNILTKEQRKIQLMAIKYKVRWQQEKMTKELTSKMEEYVAMRFNIMTQSTPRPSKENVPDSQDPNPSTDYIRDTLMLLLKNEVLYEELHDRQNQKDIAEVKAQTNDSQFCIYTIPRQQSHSLIILYINAYGPQPITSDESGLTLLTALNAFKYIIKQAKLHDNGNKDVIIANNLMEKVLNKKTFHIQQLDQMLHDMLPIMPMYHGKCTKYPQKLEPPKNTVATEKLKKSYFMPKPEFLDLLREQGLPYDRNAFTYKQIANKFEEYIKANSSELIDKRNKSMINCMNHKLGQVMGVKAIHTSQIVPAIYGQLMPT